MKKTLQILAMIVSVAFIICSCEPKPVPVQGVTLDKTTLTLTEGDTQKLNATVVPETASNKDVTWQSSNTSVAAVVDGLVTAVAPGTASITVKTADGNFTASCAVTVEAKIYPVTGITVNPTTKEVLVGETFAITATVAPDNATNKNVTWTSDKESVATVANGTVTAVAAGSATITAKTEDGNFTATCAVTVKEPAHTLETPVLGWFVNKDGTVTETFQSSGDNQSYAVVAYVGKVEHYFDHFIAIALSDTDAEGNETSTSFAWEAGLAAVGKYAAKHPITFKGTTYNTNSSNAAFDAVSHGRNKSSATATGAASTGWHMPSVTEWRYVFQGLTASKEEGARASATDPAGIGSGSPNNIAEGEGAILRGAINTACGNENIPAGGFYWSNSQWTDDAGYCWYYRFDMNFWSLLGKAEPYPRVRAVFTF